LASRGARDAADGNGVRLVEWTGLAEALRSSNARAKLALHALKIGVIALRQAAGMIDVESMRRVGDEIAGTGRDAFRSHAGRIVHGDPWRRTSPGGRNPTFEQWSRPDGQPHASRYRIALSHGTCCHRERTRGRRFQD
jgi:hypothetical protein